MDASLLLRLHEPPPATPPRGFALWRLGFRPFYLLAALLALLSVPLWALQFSGWLPTGAGLQGSAWHAHEMVFGYALAVVIGFLFTAGRNWSGQPTPTGRALMLLAGLWVAARILVLTPWTLAAALCNVAVPWLAAWGLWRALRAGGNRRNYFFVALLLAMGLAAGAVHLTAHFAAAWPGGRAAALLQGLGLPLALDLLIFMIAVMAGRVVPMFSNNAIPGLQARRDDRLEKLALGLLLGLLGLDALGLARSPLTAVLLLAAAAAHLARWWLWQPWGTRRHPLVWVLHAAYLWLPVHLALRAAAALGWAAAWGPAQHALTVGLIGMVTLGMITRTARGHTGRPLRAGRAETLAFAALWAAAALRVFLPLAWPQTLLPSAQLSALLWSLAFALYLWRYTPWLLRPRADGRPD